jgi:hypothetical protein
MEASAVAVKDKVKDLDRRFQPFADASARLP